MLTGFQKRSDMIAFFICYFLRYAQPNSLAKKLDRLIAGAVGNQGRTFP